jgi:hypothetical protein
LGENEPSGNLLNRISAPHAASALHKNQITGSQVPFQRKNFPAEVGHGNFNDFPFSKMVLYKTTACQTQGLVAQIAMDGHQQNHSLGFGGFKSFWFSKTKEAQQKLQKTN